MRIRKEKNHSEGFKIKEFGFVRALVKNMRGAWEAVSGSFKKIFRKFKNEPVSPSFSIPNKARKHMQNSKKITIKSRYGLKEWFEREGSVASIQELTIDMRLSSSDQADLIKLLNIFWVERLILVGKAESSASSLAKKLVSNNLSLTSYCIGVNDDDSQYQRKFLTRNRTIKAFTDKMFDPDLSIDERRELKNAAGHFMSEYRDSSLVINFMKTISQRLTETIEAFGNGAMVLYTGIRPGSRPDEEQVKAAGQQIDYILLGLPPLGKKTQAEINKNYRLASLRCHPDKTLYADEEEKEIAKEELLDIQRAYERLTNPPKDEELQDYTDETILMGRRANARLPKKMLIIQKRTAEEIKKLVKESEIEREIDAQEEAEMEKLRARFMELGGSMEEFEKEAAEASDAEETAKDKYDNNQAHEELKKLKAEIFNNWHEDGDAEIAAASAPSVSRTNSVGMVSIPS